MVASSIRTFFVEHILQCTAIHSDLAADKENVSVGADQSDPVIF